MTTEQMEAHLIQKYQERLKKVIWGVNASSLIEALKFMTKAMMEESWSEKQKNAFNNFLLLSGFKTRCEGKKNEEVQFIWYFPVDGKASDKLKEVREFYQASLRETCEEFLNKTKEELKIFEEEKSNITVVKTENPLYREIFMRELKENESIKWKYYLTNNGDWLILSKSGNFYNLPSEYEERYKHLMASYVEMFIKSLNFEAEEYFKRKLRNTFSKENVELSKKYVMYLPIFACKEFKQHFEDLGFKCSYFPTSYETSYVPLGIKVSSYVEIFITVDNPKKVNNLGYGATVNNEYRKFCDIWH